MAATRTTILPVDDDIEHLFLAKKAVEEAGFQTVIAASGAEAWKKLTSQADDMIVPDSAMPGIE